MVCIAGSPPRPGLIDDGTGPDDGLEVELWNAPLALVQQLAADVASGDAMEITTAGGRRAYLAATES